MSITLYIVASIIISVLGTTAGYFHSAYKRSLTEINSLKFQIAELIRERSEIQVHVDALNRDCQTLDLQLDKLSADLTGTKDQSENSNVPKDN